MPIKIRSINLQINKVNKASTQVTLRKKLNYRNLQLIYQLIIMYKTLLLLLLERIQLLKELIFSKIKIFRLD